MRQRSRGMSRFLGAQRPLSRRQAPGREPGAWKSESLQARQIILVRSHDRGTRAAVETIGILERQDWADDGKSRTAANYN